MAMNEAERKAARKRSYLLWYAKKHGKPAPTEAELAAKCGGRAAQNRAAPKARPAPKVQARPARPSKADRPQRLAKPGKDLAAVVLKRAEKAVKKNAKAFAAVKALTKDAAEILRDAFKADPVRLAEKVAKTLAKVGVRFAPDPADPTRMTATVFAGAKAFRGPKPQAPAEPAAEPAPADPDEAAAVEAAQAAEDEDVGEGVETPVDPADLDAIAAGGEASAGGRDPAEPDPDDEEDEGDGVDEEDDEEDDDEEDDEELSDEEREERAERRRQREADADLEGRADMFGEMEKADVDFGEQ